MPPQDADMIAETAFPEPEDRRCTNEEWSDLGSWATEEGGSSGDLNHLLLSPTFVYRP